MMDTGWPRVLKYGFLQLPYKVAALFVVPFLDEEARRDHPKFGNSTATDFSYWNIAVRNSTGNYEAYPMPAFRTRGNFKGDETLEAKPGWQWRTRFSLEYNEDESQIIDIGKFVSFRCTWGPIRPKKGKREIYIGYKMNDEEVMRLTFLQARLGFEGWVILGFLTIGVFVLARSLITGVW